MLWNYFELSIKGCSADIEKYKGKVVPKLKKKVKKLKSKFNDLQYNSKHNSQPPEDSGSKSQGSNQCLPQALPKLQNGVMWMLCDGKCTYLDYDLLPSFFFFSCFFSRLRIPNILSEIHCPSLSSPIHAANNQLPNHPSPPPVISVMVWIFHPAHRARKICWLPYLTARLILHHLFFKKIKYLWLKTAVSQNVTECHSTGEFWNRTEEQQTKLEILQRSNKPDWAIF